MVWASVSHHRCRIPRNQPCRRGRWFRPVRRLTPESGWGVFACAPTIRGLLAMMMQPVILGWNSIPYEISAHPRGNRARCGRAFGVAKNSGMWSRALTGWLAPPHASQAALAVSCCSTTEPRGLPDRRQIREAKIIALKERRGPGSDRRSWSTNCASPRLERRNLLFASRTGAGRRAVPPVHHRLAVPDGVNGEEVLADLCIASLRANRLILTIVARLS